MGTLINKTILREKIPIIAVGNGLLKPSTALTIAFHMRLQQHESFIRFCITEGNNQTRKHRETMDVAQIVPGGNLTSHFARWFHQTCFKHCIDTQAEACQDDLY